MSPTSSCRIRPFKAVAAAGLVLCLASCIGGSSDELINFKEQDSAVTFEAENWGENLPSSGLQWQSVISTGSSNSAVKLGPIPENVTDVSEATLRYGVRIDISGNRYVWVRGRQSAPSSSVTVAARTGSGALHSAQVRFSNEWSWQQPFRNSPIALSIDESSLLLTVTGYATSVWLDQWIITSDASFNPVSSNPQSNPENGNTPEQPADRGIPEPTEQQESVNLAPIATITEGMDATITVNEQLTLTGSASDDGPEDQLTFYWWSVVNGADSATFTDQSSAATSVSFDSIGEYLLQFSAHDGNSNGLAETIITVTAREGEFDTRAAAHLVVESGADIASSSTYTAGSFRLENLSEYAQITEISIDLGSAAMNDLVFDPFGNAGDLAYKDLVIDSGSFEAGFSEHFFDVDNAGGFNVLRLLFNDFDASEIVTFSVDIDPANTRGAEPPGDRHSASVSGLEMAGATVQIQYSDGSSQSSRLFGARESVTAASAHLSTTPLAAPVIAVVDVDAPADITAGIYTVTIEGEAGQEVRLSVAEAALYLEGVPDGGYDVDPYEPNTIVNVSEYEITLDEEGFGEIEVEFSQSHPEAGFQILQAANVDTDQHASAASDAVLLRVLP